MNKPIYVFAMLSAMLCIGVSAAAADPNNPNSGAQFAPGRVSLATDLTPPAVAAGQPLLAGPASSAMTLTPGHEKNDCTEIDC